MAARTSMADLILRVRRLIGDPAGGDEHFGDNDIQDALDEHRLDVRDAPLQPVYTIGPGGVITYTDYYGGSNWEADITLKDASFNTLSPLTSDELVGHWTFTNQLPPVVIVGKNYDIYGAAAYLLENWGATLTTAFDYSADSASYRRSQQMANMLTLADTYRAKMRVRNIVVTRPDAETNASGAAIVPWGGDVDDASGW